MANYDSEGLLLLPKIRESILNAEELRKQSTSRKMRGRRISLHTELHKYSIGGPGRNAGQIIVYFAEICEGVIQYCYLGQINLQNQMIFGSWFNEADLAKHCGLLSFTNRNLRYAIANYGWTHKTCGICKRRLTRPESIVAGIGPKCAALYGWTDDAESK